MFSFFYHCSFLIFVITCQTYRNVLFSGEFHLPGLRQLDLLQAAQSRKSVSLKIMEEHITFFFYHQNGNILLRFLSCVWKIMFYPIYIIDLLDLRRKNSRMSKHENITHTKKSDFFLNKYELRNKMQQRRRKMWNFFPTGLDYFSDFSISSRGVS